MFKDISKIYEEVQEKFESIFYLITVEFWNGKLEDGMGKMQNAFCQQSLDLDKCIQIGEATSEAINKEKFALRGTVCGIAREESRKKYNRDFTRMKAFFEKKSQTYDDKNDENNKTDKGKKQNKK